MVRLKEYKYIDGVRYQVNFNSTMVRLKVRRWYGKKLILQFQFHYGSIKRTENTLNVVGVVKFQFHYGSIKRNNQRQVQT